MRIFVALAVIAATIFGAQFITGRSNAAMENGADLMETKPEGYPALVLGGGCFWCTESEYRAIDGVLFTRVGYMGGALDNPGYRDITTGKTGHAEVVEVTFDPEKTSYETIIKFFLTKAHDPTQLNRQGVDVGTQYRSVIFYADEAEKEKAQNTIDKVEADKVWEKPIVTTLEPESTFWLGEDYHQQYYEKYEEKTGKPHIRVMLKKTKKG